VTAIPLPSTTVILLRDEPGRDEPFSVLLAERHGRYSYELTLTSPLFSQSRERYLKAESLYRLGRLEEAASWYETLSEVAAFDLVYLEASRQRRAEIHDVMSGKTPAREPGNP